ncbi:MAG: MAPEG family protein [Alphaproteobacteria bacterium]
MTIVPAYSILFACLFLVLSNRTIRARRSARVAIGTGGDKSLERLSRVHANFAEYVPFTLLLIAFAEMRGIHYIVIHILCIALLVGRTVHAWGVSKSAENFRFRVIGMMLTIYTIGAAALANAVSYFL